MTCNEFPTIVYDDLSQQVPSPGMTHASHDRSEPISPMACEIREVRIARTTLEELLDLVLALVRDSGLTHYELVEI